MRRTESPERSESVKNRKIMSWLRKYAKSLAGPSFRRIGRYQASAKNAFYREMPRLQKVSREKDIGETGKWRHDRESLENSLVR
jgi:hypothetical protein